MSAVLRPNLYLQGSLRHPQLQDELKRLRNVNEEGQVKLDVATRDADRDAGDIEKLKAELARREGEIERVRLELDDIRNQSSALGYATPRTDGYRSSEPPSYALPALLDRARS